MQILNAKIIQMFTENISYYEIAKAFKSGNFEIHYEGKVAEEMVIEIKEPKNAP